VSGCLQQQLDRRTVDDQSVLKSTAGEAFQAEP